MLLKETYNYKNEKLILSWFFIFNFFYINVVLDSKNMVLRDDIDILDHKYGSK